MTTLRMQVTNLLRSIETTTPVAYVKSDTYPAQLERGLDRRAGFGRVRIRGFALQTKTLRPTGHRS
jgi:hypothetical protein